jgi:hypothetical protein
LFGFGRDRLGSYSPLMLAAAAVMVGAVLLLRGLGRHTDTSAPSSAAR